MKFLRYTNQIGELYEPFGLDDLLNLEIILISLMDIFRHNSEIV